MYHNIRLLAQKHCVRVLSFVENNEEKELLKSAGPVCESVTAIDRVSDLGAHWTSLVPFVVREFGTPAMHQAVDEALRLHKIDVIQCEYLQMAQYKRAGAASILTILETHSDNAYHAFQAEPDAIQKLRKVMGATDPAKADAGTIRKLFATNIERNAIHGSDGPDTAAYEISYFFNRLEIV